MKSLLERLRFASVVLRELSRQPLSRTNIEKRATRRLGTHASFEGIFKFLVKSGFVQKSGSEHRAPYCITDKGRKLLEVLS
jgi:DNA-binding PadR family transcriptional regulator